MLKFINKALRNGGIALTTHIDSDRQIKTADEIIDNAMGLSLENQELLLMMAKAMQYTRNCISRQSTARPTSLTSRADT